VFWQRVWAGRTPRSLVTGAFIGGSAVIVAVFLFGFGGFLAAWGQAGASPNAWHRTLRICCASFPARWRVQRPCHVAAVAVPAWSWGSGSHACASLL
jgi:hypothetical protein